MPTVKDNELVLAFRMRELCRPPTAWNRSLWSVSALTSLREVLEASAVRRDGILSDASVSNLQHSTAVLLGKDPGVGDSSARKHLQGALSGKSVITPGSLAAATIDQAVTDLEANYLPRWALAIEAGVTDEIIERCARSVVSHLLNRGHSRKSVADRIWDAVLKHGATVSKASGLIRDLHALSTQPRAEFEAVFPVQAAPDIYKTASPGWMKGADLVAWMKDNGIPAFAANERVRGAVTFKVSALDRLAAEHIAAARFAAIRDRAMLGAREPIVPLRYFWLSGSPDQASVEPQSRGVEVASISRQDKIYTFDDSIPSIERSISLLAELNSSRPGRN